MDIPKTNDDHLPALSQMMESENQLPPIGPLDSVPCEIAALEFADGLANAKPVETPAGKNRSSKGFVRRVLSGTFNYGLGQSIPQLVKLLLLPVFVRLLSPAEYGAIDLANRFGGFLTTLMRQGVPGAVARFYYDHDEGPSLRDYVTTVAWFLLGSSLLVGFVAVLVCPWLLPYAIPGLPLSLALLSILSGVLICISELQSRLVQAREQSWYQARLNVGRASISISLMVVFVIVLRTGAVGMLTAEVLSYGVLALVAIYYLRSELKGRFQRSMLKSSIAYGWGMMPGDFVGSVTPLATSAILAGAQSTAANGVYFLALRVTQPLMMLAAAFQQAYNPVYFSVRKEDSAAGLQRLAITARNVWAAAIGSAVGAATLGPPLIVLVTPRDYHAAAALVPIFALSFLGMSAYYLLVPEVFYSKRTGLLPLIIYGAAAGEIAITAFAVKPFGAAGVASAAAARTLIYASIAGIISRRLVNIPHSWFNLARITLCGIAAYVPTALIVSDRTFVRLLAGFAGPALYLCLLFLAGDPSVREGFAFVKRRVSW